ncbi:MAG: DUF1566 domain-containing protein [Bacteroidales bacterium]|nr:DUF1566 domain-containing protein [Bacteroidales bacterium]
MKNFLYHFIFIISAFLFVPKELYAQVPQNINFQAIINDADGNSVEATIGLKVSILKDSESGTLVYSERHTIDSDEHGLVRIKIGAAETVYLGKFDTIDWSAGPYFAKIDISPTGGFNYSISTTSEMSSVPFALYALKAESVAQGFAETDPVFAESAAYRISEEDTIRWNSVSKKSRFSIGDIYAGGIIFYLEPNGEHGLMASLNDIASDAVWSPGTSLTNANSTFNGYKNSADIVALAGPGNYAAYYCDTLSTGGNSDWFLPSTDELFLLFKARYSIDKALEEDNVGETTGLSNESYWTSTERNVSEAHIFKLGAGSFIPKSSKAQVRAIRAF